MSILRKEHRGPSDALLALPGASAGNAAVVPGGIEPAERDGQRHRPHDSPGAAVHVSRGGDRILRQRFKSLEASRIRSACRGNLSGALAVRERARSEPLRLLQAELDGLTFCSCQTPAKRA